MRLARFLLAFWMVSLADAGEDVATPTTSTPGEPLETEVFRLGTARSGIQRPRCKESADVKPATAQTIEDFLRTSGVPWPVGSDVCYENETGTLIVTNTPTNMVIIRELVRLWAQPVPQVEIEARFVKVCAIPPLDQSPEAETIVNLLFPGERDKLSAILSPSEFAGTDSGRIPSIRAILSADDFDVLWRAIDEKDWSDLLFAPRVTTITGNCAVIEVVPKDNGLSMRLEVTPSVGADGKTVALVIMIKVEVPRAAEELSGEAAPSTETRSVGTTCTVHLKDGETVVLVGPMPGVSPLEGDMVDNLLVFVTPRIVRPSGALDCVVEEECK